MQEDIIVRKHYRDKINPFIGRPFVKVLTGPRHVGKSYVLKQTMQYIRREEKSSNILYINKEDLQSSQIKTDLDLTRYVSKNTKKTTKNYVFIDDIQAVWQFAKAISSLLSSQACDLYCTGDCAGGLLDESVYLRERCVEIPIHSLSYGEFLRFHGLKDNHTSLIKYLKYGGLPYLTHLELTDEIVYDYLRGVYCTMMYRDVVMRHELRNSIFLENLVVLLASHTGHLLSSKKMSDYLQLQNINIAVSQIITYMKHLESARLIQKIQRMDIAKNKVFQTNDKFYFEDLGIRNAVAGYKQDDMDMLIENAVYLHLLINGYDVRTGQAGNAEVSFVARQRGETIYIQTGSYLRDKSTIERVYGSLEKIKDNYPKLVVSMDEFSGNIYRGIQRVYLKDFLSEKVAIK